MTQLTPVEKEAVIIHVIFSLICLIFLFSPISISVGIRLLLLVIIYNLFMPAWGLYKKYENWTSLWIFAFILSLFQVFPDWFLSLQLNVLVFPEDGCFRIGTVSGYMAGLWTIPVFMIIYIGESINRRYSKKITYIAVAFVSFIIFAGSEQTLWILPSWQAQHVHMIGHVAGYIIIPEIIFGVSAFACYTSIKKKSHLIKIPFAFFIMLLYMGSASFFYLFFETIVL